MYYQNWCIKVLLAMIWDSNYWLLLTIGHGFIFSAVFFSKSVPARKSLLELDLFQAENSLYANPTSMDYRSHFR